MTSVASEGIKPSFGIGGVNGQGDGVEVANLKKQLAAADSATGSAVKELEHERTKSAAAIDKLSKAEKELKKLKKIISIMQESGKLDAKKFAAAEKFVNEFFE